MPIYLFSGGLAGASAVMAAFATATGRASLARTARLGACAGALSGAGFLIHDLGRPARFLYMLRVIKPTSPLSVGTWILSPFSALSTTALMSDLTGIAPRLGRAAGLGAAVLGPAMTSYTGVPGRHRRAGLARRAPRAAGALRRQRAGRGRGLGIAGAGVADNAPAARLGALGAAAELAVSAVMERRLGMIRDRYRTGRAGRWIRAARVLSAAGIAGALAGRRQRALAAVSGLALMAGSLATRFGVFEAGKASAADPRDVIVPQRARLATVWRTPPALDPQAVSDPVHARAWPLPGPPDGNPESSG